MKTAERVLSHYSEVLKTEEEALARIANEPTYEGSTQSADTRMELLYSLGVSPVTGSIDTHTVGSYLTPRPSLKLIREGISRLSVPTLREPEIGTFLTETLFPLAGLNVPTGIAEATLTFSNFKGACVSAEDYYGETLKQVQNGRFMNQPIISVYHDLDGQPLALRKSQDESSALTLIPLDCGSVTVPSGTIVGIDGQNAAETGHYQGSFKAYTYQVYGPINIAPNRLSPWVYDEAVDRASFAIWGTNGTNYEPRRGKLVRGSTIDDFRQAADTIMSMCGVV